MSTIFVNLVNIIFHEYSFNMSELASSIQKDRRKVEGVIVLGHL
jgi:hypothetical protein